MFVPVSSQGSDDEIAKAIAVPEVIWDDKGRRFDLREWHPHVVVGEVVQVTLTAIVRLPKQ
jgi:hypothetical protein